MKKKLLTPVILLLIYGLQLYGQDHSFTASAPAAVTVGEQFQYVVEGSERGNLRLPEMPGFQLLAGPFSSYSSQSQWINGKMSMKTVVTYTHVLRATSEGTYTIAPATVRVGRKEYKTNEVQIVVHSGSSPSPGTAQPGQTAPVTPGDRKSTGVGNTKESAPVFLRILPSKREVYMGEQLVAALKVYTRVNTRPASSAKDVPYEGFFKKSLDPDAAAQRETINGEQYVTQVIQRHILIPQKSGEIVIPPYESEWMIQQRVKRRSNNIFDDFFNDPFFDNYKDVPVKLSTRPVSIHVKQLPPGAPAGFTGAVGNFTMDASLSAGEIEVNEALSLKITIRGTGNLPLLGKPEVNLPPDHDLYDVTRSVHSSTSGNRISGSVTFEYPIVARHAGRFRIAPVRFSWFDPVSKKYHTTTTEEFTFNVLKGKQEEGTGNVYVPGVMHESVDNLGRDIRDISREIPDFTPVASSLFANRIYRMLYPVTLVLGILILILIRLVSRRNADLTLVRNRQANRSARARLKKADRLRKGDLLDGFYEEIGKAIWGYLADKLNIETSRLSRELILEQLENRGVDRDLREELLRILDNSEFSRFAPSAEKSDVNQLYSDAAGLIRNLENSLK